jgi:hypothetical protein
MEMHTTANSPPEFPNEPLIHPVRLQTSSYPIASQIYAYPSQRPPQTLIQLPTTIPAIVEYILDWTWREHLSELGTISVPRNWTNDDETALTLRVLRSDGAIMDHSSALDSWWVFEDGFGERWLPGQRQQKYMFGWPTTGGVWVLRLPPLLETDPHDDSILVREMEEYQQILRRDRSVYRRSDGSVSYGDLEESETMDELFRRLKEKGAMFYAEVGDSSGVIESGLLNGELALR